MRISQILAASVATVLSISLSSTASADEDTAEKTLESWQNISAPAVRHTYLRGRAQANDQIIMPGGFFTIGGAMKFITADNSPVAGDLRFTDVALISLRARYSINGRAEIFAGSAVLPKQPSFTDESVWQSSELGARVGFAKRYAGWASVSAGPMLGNSGFWGSAEAGLEARKSIDPTVVFQGRLGGSATRLRPDATAGDSSLVELVVEGEIVFRDPYRGEFAAWLGTQFRFPVSSTSDLDPQTRLNVSIGGVLAYIKDWDIFAQLSAIDRGDMVAPETTLPILDGGFDQTQLIIGIARRFRAEKIPSVPIMLGN